MRITLGCRRTGNAARFAAIFVDDPNVAAIFKSDLCGAEAGLSQQTRALCARGRSETEQKEDQGEQPRTEDALSGEV